ncbi:MAG: preprotein translocase subunit SecB [Methylophilaceae bacterium]|jgi:preprotein translocase subunit SecB|tara:strand:+ start:251 stop:742 length:492 start_codon:yes stop_codon:yes gene_type:complete
MAVDKKNTTKLKSKVKVGEESQPGFAIEKLYLKDVSVEVPNSPEIFTSREAPKISVELNNETKPLADDFYEVSLQLTITSKINDQTAFVVDVVQAGIFAIKNIPDEGLETVLSITCCNILFPYAREAIANLTVKAGFNPVQLQPINFEALYMQEKQKKDSKKS